MGVGAGADVGTAAGREAKLTLEEDKSRVRRGAPVADWRSSLGALEHQEQLDFAAICSSLRMQCAHKDDVQGSTSLSQGPLWTAKLRDIIS